MSLRIIWVFLLTSIAIYGQHGKSPIDGKCDTLQFFSDPAKLDLWMLDDARDAKKTSKVKTVGVIGKFTIVEVLHEIVYTSSPAVPEYPAVRFLVEVRILLVKQTPTRYCAFSHQSEARNIDANLGGEIVPASIIIIDGQKVLQSLAWTGGQIDKKDEEFWLFDDQGPKLIKFDRFRDAIKTLLPDGAWVQPRDLVNVLPAQCWSIAVWKKEDRLGPTGGKIVMKLKLEGDQVVAAEKQYDPDPDSQSGCKSN